MNLREARVALMKSHRFAVRTGKRATAYELTSGPGLGKSSMLRDICRALAVEFNAAVGLRTVMLATLSSADVVGFMLPSKMPDGTLVSTFSKSPLFPTAQNIEVFTPDGKHFLEGAWMGPLPEFGVAFLDEFGQAPPEVACPAAEFVLQGKLGTEYLPMGWRVVAASNRVSDKAGVHKPLTHIVNRRVALPIDGSFKVWFEDFVQSRSGIDRPHHLLVSFARKNESIVFKEHTPTDGKPFCSPRTLVMFDQEMKSLRTAEEEKADIMPTDATMLGIAIGLLGEGDAAMLSAHLKYGDRIPEPADVLANPTTAKVPDGLDAQMVTSFMLAGIASPKTVGKVFTYMQRLHVEMQALTVRTLTSKADTAAALVALPEYVRWNIANKDILMASRL